MYAVIKTGGKQYKVSLGEVVRFEKLKGNRGEKVNFNNVLMVNNNGETNFGKPEISGIPVVGEIMGQGNSKKIRIVKKRRRKNYRKTQGHRQPFTAVKIISIGEAAAASGTVTYAASGTITGAAPGKAKKTVRKRTVKTAKTAKTAKSAKTVKTKKAK